MNSHDEFRELAALRVYGELDASERVRLERHLSECAECAALARDLEAGLGRLVPAARRDDLPNRWRAGLEAAIVAEPPWARLPSRLRVAAASFLVGAAVAGSIASAVQRAGGGEPDRAAAAAEPAAFERSTPPPRARDGVSMPPLAELYLRR
jgi:anti-sigma factor RsiW